MRAQLQPVSSLGQGYGKAEESRDRVCREEDGGRVEQQKVCREEDGGRVEQQKVCREDRVGIKKPTQKNPPKKTQKNPPKKPTKNVFFWVFYKLFSFKQIFYEQISYKLSFINQKIVRYALN